MESSSVERWFLSPPRATCLDHARLADSVCGRCGAFQCEACLGSAHDGLCQPCAVLTAKQALPALSRRVAWKLVFLPVVGLGCLLSLAARGAPLSRFSGEQTGFLLAWGVPLLCGLALLVRPRALPALAGSLAALALVALVLVPPLLADFTGLRVLDLVLLGAGPAVALVEAVQLDRVRRRHDLLERLAA
ncbi:MAG: hypothetical protein INH41_17875 [Myxococcaceae bacterium]|jgi:hypothetical protein|nr:hypothetical protein [Myxococcaceae bacterium]MCA3014254.1 hypothetical protein [Myxococcaceae bacterium]